MFKVVSTVLFYYYDTLKSKLSNETCQHLIMDFREWKYYPKAIPVDLQSTTWSKFEKQSHMGVVVWSVKQYDKNMEIGHFVHKRTA